MIGFLKNLFGEKADLAEVVQRDAVILDVRTVNEYQQARGKNSKNIPLNELGSRINEIRKWAKPVITCCASGVRSAAAAKALKRHGIEAYNGGSWQKADALTN
ncbi:MAG: rhodanese-like domain-containing protein [Bacteroidia bacterium]|nr:rhodanese-like domain-containing protein [Bacteroidia bacterium]